jgi:N-acetylglucosaminyldiphosphoundecaprenol N-acetyl-beta-D-mannosaminyltransferase
MVPVSVKVLGVKVTLMNREELKEFLIQTIYDKGRFRTMILDEKKMFFMLFNKEFQKIINDTEIVLCSSQMVSWMIRVLTGKHVPIIMPVTVLLDFMRVADEMNYTVFLFGGTKSVSAETMKRIKKSFPQSRIVGNYRSNIKNKELEDVLTTIRKSSPQLFFASIGGGFRQEKWLTSNKGYFQNSTVVGIDRAFHIIAGKHKMPPMGFQKKGWNGLYFLLTQPYNLFRLARLIVLFFVTLYHKIRMKLGRKRKK